MADEEEQQDVEENEEIAFESNDGEFEGPAPGKKSSLKKILFIVLPVLLLLGAGAGVYLSGLLDLLLGGGKEKAEGEEHVEVDDGPAVYFELPEMLVNLNSTGRRTNYLKITVALEVSDKADLPQLEEVLPRIVDSFQVFLRELRVNAATGSTEVRDVLFREMLVQ